MKKFVITGAPGTGKTSIINHLKIKGYNCIDEISRKIISEQLAINGEVLPWKNLSAFSKRVFTLRESQLLNSKNTLIFFDRGIVDVYAYMKVDSLKIPKHLEESIKKNRYNTKVFYTPIWEKIYVNDKQRKESIEQAKIIENVLLSSYRFYNYQLIKVPKDSVEERANFILAHIK
ncbi:MAG: hypothetical protein CMD22_05390 [Flavobacteriales bacterium]|nr:hypothetical protein [Flavobacteriales bacterium]|tara:strand:- start:5636 stop:6160 length:525 start_codon:yes stop_codon:yes gene_type:complete